MAKARPKVEIKREKPALERKRVSIARRSQTLGRNAPDFESMFDDGDENLFAGAEFNGDLQDDADTAMSEALRAVIERKKASQDRFRTATDPDFYFLVCFQNREQKEWFLEKAGWQPFDGRYLNGLEVARILNIEIPAIPIEPLKLRGKVKRFKPGDILRKGGE